MTEYIEYGKPCMTNLPYDLGKAIIEQILNTPQPDQEKIDEEVKQLENDMIQIRKSENAKQNYSG